MAVGSPVGYSDSIAYGVVTSVTNKISALDNEYNLLTTDILGSTDGSGILVNLDGEIVGIIAQSYSAKGNNVVTGIAISQIKKLIEEKQKKGWVILFFGTDMEMIKLAGEKGMERVKANISPFNTQSQRM